jgi:hypothetical protein
MTKSKWLVASVTALIVFGCTSQKEPAERAVANIDAALGTGHDAAAKYALDGLQSVEAQVATLKDNLSKGEYKKVLADAPAVTTAVANLQQAAIAKHNSVHNAQRRLSSVLGQTTSLHVLLWNVFAAGD